MSTEDTSNQAAGGFILLAIGIILFLIGGDWFLDHYDTTRVK